MWGIHAVVHAYEMQGMVDDGIRFLRSRETDWGDGNLFTVHNWWHLALYLLEAGRHDEVLAIYDAEVHNDGSPGVPLEMLDAERAAVAVYASTRSTRGTGSPRWPTRGQQQIPGSRGTPSTTSTR